MKTEIDNLNLLIQQTSRDSFLNNNYRNLSKHSNCSKCQIALTKDNYKKDITICRKCLNVDVMYYNKNRYDNQSSCINKTNNSIKDNDPNCVSLKNKKENTSTRSRNITKDASTNNLEDIDLNILSEK